LNQFKAQIQIELDPPPYTVVGVHLSAALSPQNSSTARTAHRPTLVALGPVPVLRRLQLPARAPPHSLPLRGPTLRPDTQSAPAPPASYSLLRCHLPVQRSAPELPGAVPPEQPSVPVRAHRSSSESATAMPCPPPSSQCNRTTSCRTPAKSPSRALFHRHCGVVSH
jgi:hypothetical protein